METEKNINPWLTKYQSIMETEKNINPWPTKYQYKWRQKKI